MDVESLRKAGKIAAEAREFGKNLVKSGSKVVEVCDKIEAKIASLGGQPAFPVQVSLNHIAAHSCPDLNDEATFTDQLVKLDLGVAVNGMIGDNAVSIDLSGNHADLIKAAEEARDKALDLVKEKGENVTLAEIGRTIETTIHSYNFKPIRNLSGHGLGENLIHTPPTIPNHDTGEDVKLGKGVFAIEPFSTTGAGLVAEGEHEANIFSLVAPKPIRSVFARQILQHIEKEYSTLPFTTRWLMAKFGEGKTKLGLKELRQVGAIHAYPPLFERGKGVVAQAEHTILIDDKVEIITQT
ncbi:MAG: type II methionyl aminopeptidase [Candidatus Woesearchaeota archaeon]|jgi:methionyl aminopeptidase|nr:type II methionyl aminopeptidase [Candidatus Woesearchaeota archaeon]MDP7181406.1 type II methionyl aminopeptidase [Candidatus Woesearchaeota archaeon]MDP7198448.1 type II methionyl aminopeptidase [Candidatus Woesearchaeota archaeon]MDP7466810.1 type II methionyl aminopeptidase [Candidatus Woesearchaeota archaeon]MDP7648035.1 type II methionyl aminopeptidase [Candidatus Woesearchaeota archaeon]